MCDVGGGLNRCVTHLRRACRDSAQVLEAQDPKHAPLEPLSSAMVLMSSEGGAVRFPVSSRDFESEGDEARADAAADAFARFFDPLVDA